ncbi:hypothetical protein NL108_014384 [Boleophthalmus pectinirostris]|uniref:cartilage intermediate layer protein 1-like n=1 Tax=Boleophthalmus pectinirostris TaxID=150288 RepID=UPI00242CE858|nr:cartilage intermediate layer protein 1-like [Boleophthalmus pectinirostris]KAJ0061271.1 hypothetical protein NL108_014384 [Boleophthalmus pectinirostris]
MRNLLGLVVIAGLISAGSLQPTEPLPLAIKKPVNERCWTEWFDRDNPSGTGDWELLTQLRKKYPGKICDKPVDIEARTWSGKTPAAAGDTVEMDKDKGFVCKNKDQKDKRCNDYRVRFSCYSPYCAEEVCWTGWFDRDDPSGTGDWETLSSLQKQYPGKICKKPKYIEVVTVSGNVPATATGQDFYMFNPTEGFVCKKSNHQDCKDYKVRFGCCCD